MENTGSDSPQGKIIVKFGTPFSSTAVCHVCLYDIHPTAKSRPFTKGVQEKLQTLIKRPGKTMIFSRQPSMHCTCKGKLETLAKELASAGHKWTVKKGGRSVWPPADLQLSDPSNHEETYAHRLAWQKARIEFKDYKIAKPRPSVPATITRHCNVIEDDGESGNGLQPRRSSRRRHHQVKTKNIMDDTEPSSGSRSAKPSKAQRRANMKKNDLGTKKLTLGKKRARCHEKEGPEADRDQKSNNSSSRKKRVRRAHLDNGKHSDEEMDVAITLASLCSSPLPRPPLPPAAAPWMSNNNMSARRTAAVIVPPADAEATQGYYYREERNRRHPHFPLPEAGAAEKNYIEPESDDILSPVCLLLKTKHMRC